MYTTLGLDVRQKPACLILQHLLYHHIPCIFFSFCMNIREEKIFVRPVYFRNTPYNQYPGMYFDHVQVTEVEKHWKRNNA